jgi:hypothetical protein
VEEWGTVRARELGDPCVRGRGRPRSVAARCGGSACDDDGF